MFFFLCLACTLQHDPDIFLNSGEGHTICFSPGCLWVPAMKVMRQGPRFGGLTADPQLTATKRFGMEIPFFFCFKICNTAGNYIGKKMHLPFMCLVEISVFFCYIFDPHIQRIRKYSCKIRSWMTLGRIFPKSWLMSRRMKAPWVSGEMWVLNLQLGLRMWMFPRIGVPQNGWLIMETPVKMDDLGVPLFLETPMYLNVGMRSYCRWFHVMLPSQEERVFE